MKKSVKAVLIAVIACLGSQVCSTQAVTVTVQEMGVSPAQIANINVSGFYSGGAYAGIVKLKVDGIAMDGFCIDPYHFSSSSPLTYTVLPLENAPKAPGTMGADKALEISKLWAMAYNPAMTASAAAGMQIAIWEIVGGDDFSVTGNDYGAAALIASISSYTGEAANLIGLSGSGQDYVVQSVPDGGATALLLGLGFIGMAAFRKRAK